MSWKDILKFDEHGRDLEEQGRDEFGNLTPYTQYKNYIHSQYEKNRNMENMTHKELVKEYDEFEYATSEGPYERDGEWFDNQEYDHKMMILHEYRLRVKEGRAKYPIAIENEENLLKAKKVAKDTNPFNWIKAEYRKWIQETSGTSGEDMGVASGFTLHQMVRRHGRAKRKGTSGGGVVGAYVAVEKLRPIMQKDLTKEDADDVLELIPYLERMEGHPKSNPANIGYTTPKRVTDGKKSKEKVIHYGHYRTKHYKEIRGALGKDTVSPVNDDWYSTNRDEAKPPLWQAIFAGGNRGHSSKRVVTKGLLTILEEYKKELGKIKAPPPESVVQALLRESGNYRAGTNVLNYTKSAAFLAEQGMPGLSISRIDNLILDEMGQKIKDYRTPNGGKLRLKSIGSGKARRYGLQKAWMEWLRI